MELCDLGDEASIEPVAAAVRPNSAGPTWPAKRPSSPRACWRSAPVRAAAAALAADPEPSTASCPSAP